MNKDFLGTGIGLDKKGKGFRWVESEDSIRDSIQNILGTMLEERLMRPDFGSQLHTIVFDLAGREETNSLAVSYAKEALEKWEPRIEVTEITAKASHFQEGVGLLIEISYIVLSTNKSDNMVYPFYKETQK